MSQWIKINNAGRFICGNFVPTGATNYIINTIPFNTNSQAGLYYTGWNNITFGVPSDSTYSIKLSSGSFVRITYQSAAPNSYGLRWSAYNLSGKMTDGVDDRPFILYQNSQPVTQVDGTSHTISGFLPRDSNYLVLRPIRNNGVGIPSVSVFGELGFIAPTANCLKITNVGRNICAANPTNCIKINNVRPGQLDIPQLIIGNISPQGLFSLSWSPIVGATNYHIQIATDINFSQIISTNNNTFTAYQAQLPPNLYYIRVRAENSTTVSNYFTTIVEVNPTTPSIWELDIEVTEQNKTFGFNYFGVNAFLTIDWGDGIVEYFTGTAGVPPHVYNLIKNYKVKITGSLSQSTGSIAFIHITPGNNIVKSTSPIPRDLNIGRAENMFTNCSQLTFVPPTLFTNNFSPITSFQNCFNGTPLTTETYSNLLINLASNAAQLPNNVPFGANSSKYNAAGQTARQTLQAKGWTFNDLGLESPINGIHFKIDNSTITKTINMPVQSIYVNERYTIPLMFDPVFASGAIQSGFNLKDLALSIRNVPAPYFSNVGETGTRFHLLTDDGGGNWEEQPYGLNWIFIPALENKIPADELAASAKAQPNTVNPGWWPNLGNGWPIVSSTPVSNLYSYQGGSWGTGFAQTVNAGGLLFILEPYWSDDSRCNWVQCPPDPNPCDPEQVGCYLEDGFKYYMSNNDPIFAGLALFSTSGIPVFVNGMEVSSGLVLPIGNPFLSEEAPIKPIRAGRGYTQISSPVFIYKPSIIDNSEGLNCDSELFNAVSLTCDSNAKDPWVYTSRVKSLPGLIADYC